jgi:hypothetical protein
MRANVPAVRVLIVIAGLLAVAGVAAGADTRPVTLSSSVAPVDAVAQDGGLVGWLAGGGSKCNVVHVLSPDGTQAFPKPATDSMTCHWDLSAGNPQLALAAGSSAALWNLHATGSVPFDYVMSAKVGGREVRVDRLAHESDGNGSWLGGIAGEGTTLAYSMVDVEYVDQLGCLSGSAPCKKKIAFGGVFLVADGEATRLPGSDPALELAASAGRLAYVPARAVAKNGQPMPNRVAPIEVVDARTGAVVSQAPPNGLPLAIALSPRVLAVLTRTTFHERITWYDAADGVVLGSTLVPGNTSPQLAAGDRTVVYRVGRVLRAISTVSKRVRTLARFTSSASVVGLSIQHGRVIWAENADGTGRVRSLSLG